VITAIESDLATKECIADVLFLSGSLAELLLVPVKASSLVGSAQTSVDWLLSSDICF